MAPSILNWLYNKYWGNQAESTKILTKNRTVYNRKLPKILKTLCVRVPWALFRGAAGTLSWSRFSAILQS